MIERAPNLPEIDEVMSNFDHEINNEVADELKKGEGVSRYSGWEFNSIVWYDKKDKTFKSDVWRYHSLVDHIDGTLEEIMQNTSDEYGWE